MNIFDRLRLFFVTRCRFSQSCDLYQANNFNCEHQETIDSVSCGKWRNKMNGDKT